MRRNRTMPPNVGKDMIMRMQALSQPEIHAYVSSLKQSYARYHMALGDARKLIDDSMKTASLTAILYESREL